MILCKDCKFCSDTPAKITSYCLNPKTTYGPHVVTGEYNWNFCTVARCKMQPCGPNADCFEPLPNVFIPEKKSEPTEPTLIEEIKTWWGK